jgi:hypothetical protein
MMAFGLSTLVYGGSLTDLKGKSITTPTNEITKETSPKIPDKKDLSPKSTPTLNQGMKKPGASKSLIEPLNKKSKSLVPSTRPLLQFKDLYLKDNTIHVAIRNGGSGKVTSKDLFGTELVLYSRSHKTSWSLLKRIPRMSDLNTGKKTVDINTNLPLKGSQMVTVSLKKQKETLAEVKKTLTPIDLSSPDQGKKQGRLLDLKNREKPVSLKSKEVSKRISKPVMNKDLKSSVKLEARPLLSTKKPGINTLRIHSDDTGFQEGIIIQAPRTGYHYGLDETITVEMEFEEGYRPPWVRVSLRKGSDPEPFYKSDRIPVNRSRMDHDISLASLVSPTRDFPEASDYYVHASGPGPESGSGGTPAYATSSPFTIGELPTMAIIRSVSSPVVRGGQLTVRGTRFGSDPGEIFIMARTRHRDTVDCACPVIRWSHDLIECIVSTELPDESVSGPCDYCICVQPQGSVTGPRFDIRVQDPDGDEADSGAPVCNTFRYGVEGEGYMLPASYLSRRHFENRITGVLGLQDDDLISHVEILFDSNRIYSSSPNERYSVFVDFTADLSRFRPSGSGAHSFEIIARDEGGNELKKIWPVFVDFESSVLTVQHPADGATLEVPAGEDRGDIAFSIRAEDEGSGIWFVKVSLSDERPGMSLVNLNSPPYSFVLPMPPAGEHTFVVKAFDYADNSTKQEVTVIVRDSGVE